MSSNDRKTAFLGIPHGTAISRLRKNILFHLLKKHNENICVRCDKIIEKIEDLSIEHIKPWENISVDLFWDMNNIAFSHLRCNVPHKYHGGSLRKKIPPEGMSWCIGHQKFESIKLFVKNATKTNGLCQYCKLCRRDRKFKRFVLKAPKDCSYTGQLRSATNAENSVQF